MRARTRLPACGRDGPRAREMVLRGTRRVTYEKEARRASMRSGTAPLRIAEARMAAVMHTPPEGAILFWTGPARARSGTGNGPRAPSDGALPLQRLRHASRRIAGELALRARGAEEEPARRSRHLAVVVAYARDGLEAPPEARVEMPRGTL